MHAKDTVVDESCDGEAVKAIDEEFPELYIIASFASVKRVVHSS